ncbi:hypothetical protein MD273_03090 [Marinobacter pelagius]|uniref:hypothetical protein n=1 Tax=Marinobacter sp. C7 TaxID=2951363 RepID=UPI001EF12884|nr:hypothetical protein [Marinobacter sp. C7]MCG7198704.1 hypothetical protein [Marinobacter sp. C7]
MFWRTIPGAVNLAALSSMLLLLVKLFIFNQISEPVDGFHELGLVFEAVLTSVLASYVFYLIVVHFKEVREKKAIYPFVTRWSNLVVRDCRVQIAGFSKVDPTKLDFQTLEKQDIEAVFARLEPNGAAPLVFWEGGQANWLQYFENYRIRSLRHIDKIMTQLKFLEAPLVALLMKVQDSTHFSAIESLSRVKLNNDNLMTFAGGFYEYVQACRKLDGYLKAHAIHSANE